MQKIPTLFERDWAGDRSLVTREVHAGCEWVVAGEGRATRKLDGTCCMVRAGQLYKRRELRKGEVAPPAFEAVGGEDEETKKTTGWLPVGGASGDRYHREAFAAAPGLPDGTYELIGPKVQGNPERRPSHELVRHGLFEEDAPRDFDGLAAYFVDHDIEGIVWHHSDGRMCKIKARDFGIKRARS